MAKSFLAEQIGEVRSGLKGLAKDLAHLDSVNSQVLSRRVGVMGPGGAGGPAGGPVLFAPNGQPISRPEGSGPSGSSSIDEFLRKLSEQNAAKRGSSGGASAGANLSGSRTAPVVQATEGEKAMAKTLGESVEYIRKLMAAAKWAGISAAVALRSPKPERDALIAAYEAYVESATAGSTATKGEHRVGVDRLPPDITGGAAGAGQLAYGDLVRHTGESSAPTAGDKMVAGAVDGVTKAIDKLTAKIDTGGALAFRMKGL